MDIEELPEVSDAPFLDVEEDAIMLFAWSHPEIGHPSKLSFWRLALETGVWWRLVEIGARSGQWARRSAQQVHQKWLSLELTCSFDNLPPERQAWWTEARVYAQYLTDAIIIFRIVHYHELMLFRSQKHLSTTIEDSLSIEVSAALENLAYLEQQGISMLPNNFRQYIFNRYDYVFKNAPSDATAHFMRLIFAPGESIQNPWVPALELTKHHLAVPKKSSTSPVAYMSKPTASAQKKTALAAQKKAAIAPKRTTSKSPEPEETSAPILAPQTIVPPQKTSPSQKSSPLESTSLVETTSPSQETATKQTIVQNPKKPVKFVFSATKTSTESTPATTETLSPMTSIPPVQTTTTTETIVSETTSSPVQPVAPSNATNSPDTSSTATIETLSPVQSIVPSQTTVPEQTIVPQQPVFAPEAPIPPPTPSITASQTTVVVETPSTTSVAVAQPFYPTQAEIYPQPTVPAQTFSPTHAVVPVQTFSPVHSIVPPQDPTPTPTPALATVPTPSPAPSPAVTSPIVSPVRRLPHRASPMDVDSTGSLAISQTEIEELVKSVEFQRKVGRTKQFFDDLRVTPQVGHLLYRFACTETASDFASFCRLYGLTADNS